MTGSIKLQRKKGRKVPIMSQELEPKRVSRRSMSW